MPKPYSVAFSLFVMIGANAQTPPPGQPAQSASPSQPAQVSGAAKPMSDQTFVREASAAGLAEVADAQKALKMAKRDDVRRAAQQLLSDHQAANAKLMALAQQKNLPLSTAPAPAPAPNAGDFDSTYVTSQIKAHQIAVVLFRSQLDDGRDNDLKAFAAETLPTLEKHLAMMQSLNR